MQVLILQNVGGQVSTSLKCSNVIGGGGGGGCRGGGGDFFRPFLTSGSSKADGRNCVGNGRKGFAIEASSAALHKKIVIAKKIQIMR